MAGGPVYSCSHGEHELQYTGRQHDGGVYPGTRAWGPGYPRPPDSGTRITEVGRPRCPGTLPGYFWKPSRQVRESQITSKLLVLRRAESRLVETRRVWPRLDSVSTLPDLSLDLGLTSVWPRPCLGLGLASALPRLVLLGLASPRLVLLGLSSPRPRLWLGLALAWPRLGLASARPC